MVEQKKRIVTNPVLAAVLNALGMIEILSGTGLLVAKVWISDNIIGKLILTDVILFIATLCIYWLCCYVPKDEEHCG